MPMELTDSLKTLLIETAQSLKGSARRLCMARTVKELGRGGQQRAARELRWGRMTIRKGASITASATFGHSASPDNVTCWYIMALPCALKIYVKYFDKFLSPEPIAFQSLTKVLLFQ